MSILGGLFGHHPKPPQPPVPPKPVQSRLSVWIGGALEAVGSCTAILDQYGPARVFTAAPDPVVGTDASRWLFTFPPGTHQWGGAVAVRDVPGYLDHFERFIVAPDIPDIALNPATKPFVPCPREYRGNMCGIRLGGLPQIPGVPNADLVLSWFIDRYDQPDRARIYQAYRDKGMTDVLVSWPDSRVNGSTPEQFGLFCQEIVDAGFTPVVFLSSKYYDPHYDWKGVQANIAPVLPFIEKIAGRHCVGFELSLWLSPADVQALTDWLAPLVNPWGGKLYVHFQQGYASFDIDGPNASFAGYWNRNVGKLTGILHQRDLSWDKPMYQARLVDVLERFAGNYFCSPDSGFGHPFDLVACEITAQEQFDGHCTEEEGNAWGVTALTTTPVNGPFGPVSVMGSGNGQ